MFFEYNKNQSIHVPEPFKRIITPMMCTDTVDGRPLPFSVHFTEWEPGKKVDLHNHPTAMEAMYCLSGTARAKIDGEWVNFTPGKMIVADKHEEHCIENTGNELLRVLCIFAPPVSGADLRDRALGAVADANKE